MLRLSLLRFLLPACLLAGHAYAQQPATSRVTISPLVGPVIDRQEKATYDLFPEYSAKEFGEASFERVLAPDSTIQVRTVLTDGRTVVKPIPLTEYFALRQRIEVQARTLAPASTVPGMPAADSIGQVYRITLRSGTVLAGTLRATRPLELEFTTSKPETIIIARNQIAIMQLVPTAEAVDVLRHPSWHDIGNGNRLFFAPTARNLRKDEGNLQAISLYFLGANYGFTENFSMGLMFSVIPTVPLQYQFLALTPKFSARISEKWHAGAGVLYLRIPDFDDNNSAFGVGLAYGVATYGSADNNFTVGLGYGFSGSGIVSTPVLQVGGQKRISRRVSLISENYIIANSELGMGGLYGAKINWRRASLGLGAFYALAYKNNDDYNDYGPRIFSSYIVPVYYDFTFRFGKGSK